MKWLLLLEGFLLFKSSSAYTPHSSRTAGCSGVMKMIIIIISKASRTRTSGVTKMAMMMLEVLSYLQKGSIFFNLDLILSRDLITWVCTMLVPNLRLK